ncbi:hypothetical protein [Actinomadura sediminis]|uniref:Integral membrane protein n=1 Tax=Actinomadura sediminis TaxID=1038904 RepID=A0ABW3END9_9ACTN
MSDRRPHSPSPVWIGLFAVVAGAQIVWVTTAGGWPVLPTVAFFLGAGGMLLTFYRWRLHGDASARACCLLAFGTWTVAVVAGSIGDDGFTPSHPSYWIAAAALLIGFLGGSVTLLRIFMRTSSR